MRHSTLFVQKYFCNRIYRGSLSIYFCIFGNVSYKKDHLMIISHHKCITWHYTVVFFFYHRDIITRDGVSLFLIAASCLRFFFHVLFPSSILMYHALCNTYYTLVIANCYTIYMVWLISRFDSTYYLYNINFTVYIIIDAQKWEWYYFSLPVIKFLDDYSVYRLYSFRP